MSDLQSVYSERFEKALCPIAKSIDKMLHAYLRNTERINRISTRAKTVDSFLNKSLKCINGKIKYKDPIEEIQDQVGALIVTLYLSDVETVAEAISPFFRRIEEKSIVPDSESEFGYIGRHYIFIIPTDALVGVDKDLSPRFFELQIKTLYQYAWSETNHDLGYKPNTDRTSEERRMSAYVAAQSWGADRMLDDLQSKNRSCLEN